MAFPFNLMDNVIILLIIHDGFIVFGYIMLQNICCAYECVKYHETVTRVLLSVWLSVTGEIMCTSTS